VRISTVNYSTAPRIRYSADERHALYKVVVRNKLLDKAMFFYVSAERKLGGPVELLVVSTFLAWKNTGAVLTNGKSSKGQTLLLALGYWMLSDREPFKRRDIRLKAKLDQHLEALSLSAMEAAAIVACPAAYIAEMECPTQR